MSDETFQRARTPAQRARRVEDVLTATRRLLAEADVTALSLGAIAREAGLASSNVLRYFGSREGVLLDLMDGEYALWLPDLDSGLRHTGTAIDIDQVAATTAATLAERPLLSRLIAASSELLRYPMPDEALERCRGQGRRNQAELARILGGALGVMLSVRDQAYLVAGLHAVVGAASGWSVQAAFPVDFETAARSLLAIQLEGLVVRAEKPRLSSAPRLE
ncbi:TetR/AcrR family transcriptional regulator [Rhodococcus sp. ABRD24]|uniref:TetR/AcrR family transcriptional regulator n=1 Tax=Rhodococcus sp. ABRD24 TaxID=2507582 RepID=UPI0013F1515D|nr:TetR/AcrR family transcriptional regulator [Rhodococcus sp. ABRD24]